MRRIRNAETIKISYKGRSINIGYGHLVIYDECHIWRVRSCARASCLETVLLRARLCNWGDVLAGGGGGAGAGDEGRARAPTLFGNHPAFYQPRNQSERVLLLIASIACFFLATR